MTQHAVVIVGAGPTGLMLAGELALAAIDVVVVERRASQDLEGLRASGLHPRTIEILDQRGIAERFLAHGKRHPAAHFHVPLNISDVPSRHNYVLGLSQQQIERLLADWVSELAVPIYRNCEVTGFVHHAHGVDVALSDGRSLRVEYLVGCDGGRSLVRKMAGIEFPGWDPTLSWLIAEAETTEEPKWGFHEDAIGIHAVGKADDSGRVRMVLTEQQLRRESEPTLRDVQDALIAVYGTDFGIHSPSWLSRFTDMTRQAVAYRQGRILLAGDAAHVHPPLGGQGLNIGVQDAFNLGWKLARVIKRISPDTLLDSYHFERHPVAARVLRNTMAHVALRRTDGRSKALSQYVSEFLSMDEPRQRVVAELSGLDVHYDLGSGHPLLGRRIPDNDVITADGPTRVFALLHDACPVLINFGETDLQIAPWLDRVRLVHAKYTGTWELPVLGRVEPPSAVLIRPDGYVAWVGPNLSELTNALERLFEITADQGIVSA